VAHFLRSVAIEDCRFAVPGLLLRLSLWLSRPLNLDLCPWLYGSLTLDLLTSKLGSLVYRPDWFPRSSGSLARLALVGLPGLLARLSSLFGFRLLTSLDWTGSIDLAR
jgi:hypothetical protein